PCHGVSSWTTFSKLAGRSRPKRPTTPTSRPLFLTSPYVNASLVRGNFKTIVQLPRYVDENEWLAANSKMNLVARCLLTGILLKIQPNISFAVFEFFDYINLFYGSISDFCTAQDCPSMSAGPG